MIKHWLVTGDTHGKVYQRIASLRVNNKPEATGIIILGDVGFNIYDNNTDKGLKKKVSQLGYNLYCLRGNHELRPSQVANIQRIWDNEVNNYIYYENEFPNIRYFLDGYEYVFNGHNALTIGGAYSVDKYFRLQNNYFWNPQEQLTQQEMSLISDNVKGKHFDFVFTHTCPLSWEPVDLFLNNIDQSLVDKTMEQWLNQLKDTFDWNIWCFGHYHANRLEYPHVEQYYTNIEDMESIIQRWQRYDETGELTQGKTLGPSFYLF